MEFNAPQTCCGCGEASWSSTASELAQTQRAPSPSLRLSVTAQIIASPGGNPVSEPVEVTARCYVHRTGFYCPLNLIFWRHFNDVLGFQRRTLCTRKTARGNPGEGKSSERVLQSGRRKRCAGCASLKCGKYLKHGCVTCAHTQAKSRRCSCVGVSV